MNGGNLLVFTCSSVLVSRGNGLTTLVLFYWNSSVGASYTVINFKKLKTKLLLRAVKDALSHGVIAGVSCANTLLWQPGNSGRGSGWNGRGLIL